MIRILKFTKLKWNIDITQIINVVSLLDKIKAHYCSGSGPVHNIFAAH